MARYAILIKHYSAGVAQLVEQLICNQQAGGSSPSTSSTSSLLLNMGVFPSGQRGQTVNLLPYGYGGSNPPAPTKQRAWHCTLRISAGCNAMPFCFAISPLTVFDTDRFCPTCRLTIKRKTALTFNQSGPFVFIGLCCRTAQRVVPHRVLLVFLL